MGVGYEPVVSTSRRPVGASRPMYLVALVISTLFGLLNLVVAVWGALRGESLGQVLAALVRVAPFVALGLYVRWAYVRGPDYRPSKRGGVPH